VAPGSPDPATLSGILLFRGLPEGELERLAPLLHKRSFPSDTKVIAAEERGDSVYVILEGTAKVYVTHTDGREVILAIGLRRSTHSREGTPLPGAPGRPSSSPATACGITTRCSSLKTSK
jgi:CRP-like cAMP-binding protein